MNDKQLTPPDRAKTVHQKESFDFEANNSRVIQNGTSDAHCNFACSGLDANQPLLSAATRCKEMETINEEDDEG